MVVRLAVVSDTHLSPANTEAERNWDAVVRHLTRTVPDLIVHAGDISAEGADVRSDLDFARAQLDRLPGCWRAVPGNHDVGEPEPEWAITQRRRARYEEIIGPRFWSTDLDQWRLIGLDSQALMSGHDDDEHWWDWSAEQLTAEQPIVAVLHRPLSPTGPDEPDVDRRYLVEPYRSRFGQLLNGTNTRVVITGHAHQWRVQTVDGIQRIWAPSTWAVVSSDLQPAIGEKTVGLVELDLGRDGEQFDQPRLVIPDGVEHHITGHRERSSRRQAADGGVVRTSMMDGRR